MKRISALVETKDVLTDWCHVVLRFLSMYPVDLLIVGAGNRGSVYASYALYHPDLARVVAVAEPRDAYRERMAADHRLQGAQVFGDWREAAAHGRLAAAAVIATPDALHVEPALALAAQGYHLLLEKPMAPTETDCLRIVQAVLAHGVIVAVGHVLRYTNLTIRIKELLAAGVIGEVIGVHHLEPVGYWHFAHSYVRGNWRREQLSSPVLLAKSCHDLDWIRYIVGRRCVRVASFGSLKHFRRDRKPEEAGDRCLDCLVEPSCPYSARRIYGSRLARGESGWPVDVVTPDPSPEALERALRTGPYGRCVYECDNDVMDNQVVILQFEGGSTATFTLAAFSEAGPRRRSIFGTRGQIVTHGQSMRVHDFLTDETTSIVVDGTESLPLNRHGGGDYGLMKSFVAAVAKNDPSLILSGPEESLESHRIVFAAERARRQGTVVAL